MLVALCSVLVEPPAENDNQALARAVRRRDPRVVAALVEQHGARLLRYLIHLVGQRALAEDLFQETWVRVLERGHQFDPNRPFGGWLFAIARHLAVDLLRRKLPASLDALERPDEHLGERLPDRSTPSPFDAVAMREQREGMAALVADLPAAYREVLFLRFTEELPLNEIARVTGVALPTVKSRLYRALGHLEERIGREP
jgi:RNA polymerase sigma-70 factor (ECF subfamily)